MVSVELPTAVGPIWNSFGGFSTGGVSEVTEGGPDERVDIRPSHAASSDRPSHRHNRTAG
jgi:hypothetical protein